MVDGGQVGEPKNGVAHKCERGKESGVSAGLGEHVQEGLAFHCGIDCEEKRDLDEGGEAADEGICVVVFPEFEDFLLSFLGVVFVFFLDGFDLWLKNLVGLHGFELFLREWIKQQFDDDGHCNYGDPVVGDDAI